VSLPADAKARKRIPITKGVLDYFPDAIAEVAKVSVLGNEQHNPGEPLHWSKDKSADHADCIARHLIERGSVDVDGARHSAKLAWRALALLQTELEEEAAKPTVTVHDGLDRFPLTAADTRESQRLLGVLPDAIPFLWSGWLEQAG
jgi:hypothetical protein